MATMSFGNIAICTGGNHVRVQVSLGAKTRQLTLDRDTLRRDLTNDELESLAALILRMKVAALSNPTRQQFSDAITGTSVVF